MVVTFRTPAVVSRSMRAGWYSFPSLLGCAQVKPVASPSLSDQAAVLVS